MAYHYIESGLDNVYLADGYTLHKTPYGEGVSIQDTATLHKVIGRWIITQPTPINGAELRFLRVELDMTQKNLAGILNTTEQTLRLWEKNRNKAINGSSDRLLRAIYAEYINENSSVRRMVDRLAQLDEMARATGCVKRVGNGWEVNTNAQPAA